MFEDQSWSNRLPDSKLKFYDSNYVLFFETMYERQLIWKRRFIDKEEAPWTDDEILRDYKFTNVYRELDRNSQWLIRNIILDKTLSLKNLVWKVVFFRFFNNPETFTFIPVGKTLQTDLFGSKVKSGLKQANTLNELISSEKWRNGIPDYDQYDEDEVSKFIAGIRSVGKNPFTSAYVINSRATMGQSRDYCFTKAVIPTLHSRLDELIEVVLNAKKSEEIIKFLKKLPSTADFTAHEFYQDFTYISKYTKHEFMKFDQNDYTNVGPGASLGIRLIYPNLKANEQKNAIYRLKEESIFILSKISKIKGEKFPYLQWDEKNKEYYVNDFHNITLHNIEMWLCEFSKYWKMSIGEGRQRGIFCPRS